jgi:AraC family transcriptional regulator
MEPKIVTKSAFVVVGPKYQGKNEQDEIAQMWRAFGPRMGEIKQVANPEVSYGVITSFDEGTGEFEYIAGMEVDGVANLPEGMVSVDVPEQEYAVFTCTLPTLVEAYQQAYGTWLPQSGRQRRDGPEFELYDKEFDPQNPSSPMYIYLPIK